jgi:hypothetical protein
MAKSDIGKKIDAKCSGLVAVVEKAGGLAVAKPSAAFGGTTTWRAVAKPLAAFGVLGMLLWAGTVSAAASSGATAVLFDSPGAAGAALAAAQGGEIGSGVYAVRGDGRTGGPADASQDIASAGASQDIASAGASQDIAADIAAGGGAQAQSPDTLANPDAQQPSGANAAGAGARAYGAGMEAGDGAAVPLASVGWQWLDTDGDLLYECYYFGDDGDVLKNTTTPDGHTVDENGAWVESGRVKYRILNRADAKMSDYLAEIIQYSQYPELDDEVFAILDAFEANKNSPKALTVFRGTELEMERLYDYYTFVNNFSGGMVVTMAKMGGSNVPENRAWILYFENTLNADKRIYDYLTQAAKAYRLSKTLAGQTQSETAQRIKNWITLNVPASGLSPSYEELVASDFSYYYGAYDGKPSTCAGNSVAFCQLGTMNGLQVDFIGGALSSTGGGHSWNKQTIDGKSTWVDLTWGIESDMLWLDHMVAWWN